MTALKDLILRQIAQSGPLRVSDYMGLSLGHPEHGYYTTRDPLGAEGDFVTAPEVSQMFGELIGLWLAQAWMSDGQPAPFNLVELGPGRGTLMSDILRAAALVPGFADAARIVMVETSPSLRAVQRKALDGKAVTWVAEYQAIPELDANASYVVANEFFDALPIRQHLRGTRGWQERLVGAEGGALVFGLGPEGADPALDARFAVEQGTLVETCAPGEVVAAGLGAAIAARGGALLAIDYGEWEGMGDTLQALRAHGFAAPLDAPGRADLTAHVGFRWLAEASGLTPFFTSQGAFLERLGITARANALAKGDQADIVARQHRRLTHGAEMGSLFKVLCLRPAGSAPVPGFDP